MQVTNICNQKHENSFTSLCIPDRELRYSIMQSANKKQQQRIIEMWQNERNNPVNAIIFSKYGFLRARLFSPGFIVGFKELHKQIPIFESKFSFIERVANVIHGYNERLKTAQLKESIKQ